MYGEVWLFKHCLIATSGVPIIVHIYESTWNAGDLKNRHVSTCARLPDETYGRTQCAPRSYSRTIDYFGASSAELNLRHCQVYWISLAQKTHARCPVTGFSAHLNRCCLLSYLWASQEAAQFAIKELKQTVKTWSSNVGFKRQKALTSITTTRFCVANNSLIWERRLTVQQLCTTF